MFFWGGVVIIKILSDVNTQNFKYTKKEKILFFFLRMNSIPAFKSYHAFFLCFFSLLLLFSVNVFFFSISDLLDASNSFFFFLWFSLCFLSFRQVCCIFGLFFFSLIFVSSFTPSLFFLSLPSLAAFFDCPVVRTHAMSWPLAPINNNVV